MRTIDAVKVHILIEEVRLVLLQSGFKPEMLADEVAVVRLVSDELAGHEVFCARTGIQDRAGVIAVKVGQVLHRLGLHGPLARGSSGGAGAPIASTPEKP